MWLALIKVRRDSFRIALPIPMFLVWPVVFVSAAAYKLTWGRRGAFADLRLGTLLGLVRHVGGTSVQVRSRDGVDIVFQLY